jgi:IclR family acetate operon transcriptional repressor
VARVETPPIESVDRALRLLQELGRHGSGAMLEELADATGLPKSSVHRTLAALRGRGFAFQQDDGRYLAGSELDVRVMLQPLLLRLRDELNETVHLGVLEGADVVYLDKLESRHPLRLTSTIGGRNPAHCTAVGKAMLAWTYSTEAELRAWIARSQPLVRRTPSSITDPPALAKEMARIRADGFARDMEESEVGVRCIAAPVFVGTTRPRAAVSISAPRDRMSSARIREVAPLLMRGAAGSSGRNGDAPP